MKYLPILLLLGLVACHSSDPIHHLPTPVGRACTEEAKICPDGKQRSDAQVLIASLRPALNLHDWRSSKLSKYHRFAALSEPTINNVP